MLDFIVYLVFSCLYIFEFVFVIDVVKCVVYYCYQDQHWLLGCIVTQYFFISKHL